MTAKSYKVCKTVLRHKTLGAIMKAANLQNYQQLQELAGPGRLSFSDYRFEADTVVTLSPAGQEEFEAYRMMKRTEQRATYGALLSTIAIFVEISMLLFTFFK